MRRYLVMTDEARRHPFRASLPANVRTGRQVPLDRSRLLRGPITAEDVRQFLLAYCACFLAISAYIF